MSFDGVIKDACAPSNFPTKNVIRTGFPETDVRMICLFTMSYSRVSRRGAFRRRGKTSFGRAAPAVVEPDGIEPTTSCLQSRRSPN